MDTTTKNQGSVSSLSKDTLEVATEQLIFDLYLNSPSRQRRISEAEMTNQRGKKINFCQPVFACTGILKKKGSSNSLNEKKSAKMVTRERSNSCFIFKAESTLASLESLTNQKSNHKFTKPMKKIITKWFSA